MACLICNDAMGVEPSRIISVTMDTQICENCKDAGHRDEQHFVEVTCELCGKRTAVPEDEEEMIVCCYVCDDCLTPYQEYSLYGEPVEMYGCC